MGLDVYLYRHEGEKEIEIDLPSVKHPDGLFRIGYFRSSYNSGGINSVLHDLGISSLYEIFQPGDEYHVKPDWAAARVRCIDAIKELSACRDSGEAIRTWTASVSMFRTPNVVATQSKQAVAVYLKKLRKMRDGKGGFCSFSCSEGEFSLREPMSVRALIPGKNILGELCVYVVQDLDVESYLASLEVTLETIDWVLAQPDTPKYRLHWSA